MFYLLDVYIYYLLNAIINTKITFITRYADSGSNAKFCSIKLY